MERQKDPSEVRQAVVPEGEFQQAMAQLAQVAMQLRGDSKEKPETFLDDAQRFLNAVRDRIQLKRDPIDAAYDQFERTGGKNDLARFLDLNEGSLQVPNALLFFSGKTANKPVKRVGLAASGAVIWSPGDFPNYSPEFGQWEPMELNNFLFKSRLVKDYYAARLNDIEAQLKAVATRICAVEESAPTEAAAPQTLLQDSNAVVAACKSGELSREEALKSLRELREEALRIRRQLSREEALRIHCGHFERELTMSLKEYQIQWRRQWRRRTKAENISEGLFLSLFSIRYPDRYADYAKFQLAPSENGCKEKRQKATVRKRRSPPLNKEDGKFKRKA